MRQKNSSGRKRKPLADVSNTTRRFPISSSSSSSKARADTNPTTSTLLALISSSVASVGSSNSHEPNQESRTNPEPDSSRLPENIDKENDGHSNIDGRSHFEGKKKKGKIVANLVSSSCPPMTRNKDRGDHLKNLHNVDLSKKHLVPECKSPKKRRHSVAEAPVHALPWDFIDKQRAYFAEIDAFELLEEEVSATELDR